MLRFSRIVLRESLYAEFCRCKSMFFLLHGFSHGGVGKTETECLKPDGVLCEGKKSSVTAIPICKTKKFE